MLLSRLLMLILLISIAITSVDYNYKSSYLQDLSILNKELV